MNLERHSLDAFGGTEETPAASVLSSAHVGSFDAVTASLRETDTPLRTTAYVDCLRPHISRVLPPTLSLRCRLYANKNSFVLSSLIVSLSFAAFSNSKRFAASRMSLSSLPT